MLSQQYGSTSTKWPQTRLWSWHEDSPHGQRETTSIVSLAYAPSEVLQKEIYMFELLDSRNREMMKHLNAIVFVRPTLENVQALCGELSNPHFNSYFAYFSYFLEGRRLENALTEMARADEREVVKEVKEFYADFLAVNNNIFTFNITPAVAASSIWADGALGRVTGGVASVLLALKRKPVIRYVAGTSHRHSRCVCGGGGGGRAG